MNPETLVKWLLLNLLALILTSPSSNSRIEIITRQNDLTIKAGVMKYYLPCKQY
jgi:hypothetical protein